MESVSTCLVCELLSYFLIIDGPVSSVGIATGYGLDGPVI